MSELAVYSDYIYSVALTMANAGIMESLISSSRWVIHVSREWNRNILNDVLKTPLKRINACQMPVKSIYLLDNAVRFSFNGFL